MAALDYIPLTFAPITGPAFSSGQLDASGEKIAWQIQIPQDDTITHCGFRYGARTGTPPTYKIGFQGVGTDGNPDGTYLGGGSPASATFTPPADASWDATWQWIALDNSVALTRGQFTYIVLEYSSGTIDASNRSSFSRSMSAGPNVSFPFWNEYDGAAWAKQNTPPNWGVKSASRTYGVQGKDLPTNTSTNTAGNRVALKFSIPKELANRYTCVGMRGYFSTSSAGSNTWGLWNAAGSALGTKASVDGDWVRSAGTVGWTEVYFTGTPTILTGDTTYYLGSECVSNTILLQTLEVESSAEMAAFPGGAAPCYSAWNGSVWTDTDDRRPLVDPILLDAYGRVMPTWLMGM